MCAALSKLPQRITLETAHALFVSSKCGGMIASECDFHFLSRPSGIWETGLTLLFDVDQKRVVMVAIMMRNDELLDLGLLGDFHRLRPAAVTPAAKTHELLRRVLPFVNQHVGAARQLDYLGIESLAVLDIRAIHEHFAFGVLDAITVCAAGMLVLHDTDEHVLVNERIVGRLQILELGAHAIERDGKVLFLHLGAEDTVQIHAAALLAHRTDGKGAACIIGGLEKRKAP